MKDQIELEILQNCRQGDVPIVRVASIPKNARQQPRDNLGRFVVAHGEATGHAHCIREKTTEMYEHDGVLYLDAPGGFTLEHLKGLQETGEHYAHVYAPGVYAFGIQQEYQGEGEWDRVSD